jgi:signal transduction histidine kinase
MADQDDGSIDVKLLHFDIDASIVFQLGESLISDVVQALVELVKNSYDADSDYAKVRVSSRGKNSAEGSKYPEATGYIVVEDKGVGMDLKTIQDGWLTISNSPKRKLKKENKTTAKGRTPLGDKGLGRLGAQRLGQNVEIFTRPEGQDIEYYVGFSWKDFARVDRLTEVPVVVLPVEPTIRKQGTRIIVSDLNDIETWTDKDAINRLQVELSQMISPYQKVRKFKVPIRINNRRINLARITEDVRNAAQVRYSIKFDGEVLKINGKAKLDYFRPNTRTGREEFRVLVEEDNGERLFNFLTGVKQGKQYRLLKPPAGGWFVEYGFETTLADISPRMVEQPITPSADGQDQVQDVSDQMEEEEQKDGNVEHVKTRKVPANPGPFTGEVDSFSLDKDTASIQTRQIKVFGKEATFADYIKGLSGIRVYRDGFGIRVDRDWLNLGAQWTTAGSYYALKPVNTMGYIALSARDNPQLEETTDREGFKITPYYENFLGLLQKFVSFSEEAHEFLRRGYIKYRNLHQDEVAKIKAESTPEDISEQIRQSLTQARVYAKPLQDLGVTLDGAQQTLRDVSTVLPNGSKEIKRLQHDVHALEASIEKGRETLQKVSSYLEKISSLEASNKSLQNRIGDLNEQITLLSEAASIGLTAELLTHEVHNIANQLSERARQVNKHLKQQSIDDPTLLNLFDYIDTTVSALHKQLAHFTPALRFLREKRESIDVSAFVEDLRNYYRLRFEGQNIQFNIKHQRDEGFILKINRGKLIQIFDNIILNSEYWLTEDLRQGFLQQGIITVTIANPYVRISDNGRGVDPSVEDILFQPFITRKGRGKGRGLGLFIVEQFLESEGCAISLLTKRNKHGRFYIFELDLTGALHDSD